MAKFIYNHLDVRKWYQELPQADLGEMTSIFEKWQDILTECLKSLKSEEIRRETEKEIKQHYNKKRKKENFQMNRRMVRLAGAFAKMGPPIEETTVPNTYAQTSMAEAGNSTNSSQY